MLAGDRVYDCLVQVDMTDKDAGHPHQVEEAFGRPQASEDEG